MHEWLFIGTDNKIIMTNPQTEMGQGVNTALPQILADELDADWDTMEVRQAPLNSKFNNSMMMQMTGGSMPPVAKNTTPCLRASRCWLLA
jgi:isoquinoline 1-oxidoreductase beta subunit